MFIFFPGVVISGCKYDQIRNLVPFIYARATDSLLLPPFWPHFWRGLPSVNV